VELWCESSQQGDVPHRYACVSSIPCGPVHIAKVDFIESVGMTKRRNNAMFVLLAACLMVQAFVPGAGRTGTAFAEMQSVDLLLDGTADIDESALADLAMERARLGAQWLAGVVRTDGSFFYIYDPVTDLYEEIAYNEVRHAGTTYAMFQVYGATEDPIVLEGAERAASFIDTHSLVVPGGGRAFVDPTDGITKLGGQALAIVALLERRRVTQDERFDPLIEDLATFMMSMELPSKQGRYFQSYDAVNDEMRLLPHSNYYPGEALLALTRMAQHFPDGPYLAAAERAADYLIYRKDGDLPALGTVPRDDHWLAMALSDLYRLRPEPDYALVATLLAKRKIARQLTLDDGDPALIGAARPPSDGVVRFGSTATKGEALVAVWSLAMFLGDQTLSDRLAEATRRNTQFLMRVQYSNENRLRFPRSDRAIGGWGFDSTNLAIRIDTVQHSISALIGVWYMTVEGDLPVASAT
jgi:hypothetical protein